MTRSPRAIALSALGALAALGACTGELRSAASTQTSPTHSADAAPGTSKAATEDASHCQGIGGRALRRLSRSEYDNTIQDLLGLQAHASERFAADTVVNGFDNNIAALSVSPLFEQQLYETSEQLAADAVKDLSRLAPCASKTPDIACAVQFVRDFGGRAFRRPLTDAEAARYLELHALGSQDGGFAAGVALALAAMLQSPNLLYRAEIGQAQTTGETSLDAYELASELAYTLAGSTPDAALLAAARDDALRTPAQLEAQAMRLIDSPRGHQQLVRFVREWLDLDRLASVPKDALLFPEWNAQVRTAMAAEFDHFVEHASFEGAGTLQSLLSMPSIFVNDALSRFYGVALPSALDASGFGIVTAPDPERSGLLTLGAVMATHARPDSSSPVHRGKLVRERVLCQPLAPPPPGIVVQPPPVDPTRSVRERYAAHSQKEPCQSCHRLIDPIGFGFEHYDSVGRYRELDAERPIDASGQIVDSNTTDAKFGNAAQLSSALARSEEVQSCFAMQWFRFAYGLSEDGELRCALAQMQQNFRQSGGSIQELLLSTIRTRHFGTRASAAEQPPQMLADAGTPTPTPSIDAGTTPMPAPGMFAIDTRTDSSWATGHCDSVTVTNTGATPSDWTLRLMLDGTLTDHWNSSVDAQSGAVTFSGADWNRTLKPGASAQFGYCVSTTQK